MSNKPFKRISNDEYNKLAEVDRVRRACDGSKATSKQRRFDTLTHLIEKMYSSKMATEREIRAVVTPDEWMQYQDTKHLPKPPKMTPFMRQQFTKYNELLRSADRRFDRAENSTATDRIKRNRMPIYKNPYRIAEGEYGNSLEILEELLECEPNAREFLDRPVFFDFDHATSPDQDSVPRLLTSRSPHLLREGEHYPTNKELRLSTLLASRNKLMDVD